MAQQTGTLNAGGGATTLIAWRGAAALRWALNALKNISLNDLFAGPLLVKEGRLRSQGLYLASQAARWQLSELFRAVAASGSSLLQGENITQNVLNTLMTFSRGVTLARVRVLSQQAWAAGQFSAISPVLSGLSFTTGEAGAFEAYVLGGDLATGFYGPGQVFGVATSELASPQNMPDFTSTQAVAGVPVIRAFIDLVMAAVIMQGEALPGEDPLILFQSDHGLLDQYDLSRMRFDWRSGIGVIPKRGRELGPVYFGRASSPSDPFVYALAAICTYCLETDIMEAAPFIALGGGAAVNLGAAETASALMIGVNDFPESPGAHFRVTFTRRTKTYPAIANSDQNAANTVDVADCVEVRFSGPASGALVCILGPTLNYADAVAGYVGLNSGAAKPTPASVVSLSRDTNFSISSVQPLWLIALLGQAIRRLSQPEIWHEDHD